MAVRERLSSLSLAQYAIAALLGAGVFVLAYDDGTYSLSTQAAAGVVAWWGIFLACAMGLGRLENLGRAGRWIAVALTGFAAWTLASAWWSASAEVSVGEFDRTLLYLGIFLFVALLARPGSVGSWADGLAIGIAGVAFVSLASRLFPSLFSDRGLAASLPPAETRLSFPLGYWNGLGIFCALGVPLLLRSALIARTTLLRSAALAPVPVIAADIYLASSRGAVIALAVGTVAILAASNRRAELVGTIAIAAAGSALTIAVLVHRHALVEGPLTGATARHEGTSAALLIAVCCLGSAASYALGCIYWPVRFVPSARVARTAAVVAILAASGIVVAGHPVRRFDAFKQLPSQGLASAPEGYVTAHLLSGSGNGRWQLWSSAVAEWRTKPWIGRGAGSFEAWWAAHRTVDFFVKDAHSLYLQTLGEVGLVGLVLLLAALLGGVAAGFVRVRGAHGEDRVTSAALLAVVLSYAVAAAADWIWELTVVSIVMFICLALLAVPPAAGLHAQSRRRRSLILAALACVAALGATAIEGDQLLGQARVQASQEATTNHDLDAAFADAVDARDLQPWAASPYLQIALVAEQQGELVTAARAIAKATARAPDDWSLWLVRARIETERGMIRAGVRALRRAQSLNPRSPLFG